MKIVYLKATAGGCGGMGGGTPENPLRVMDADDFDAVLKKYRSNTRFVLQPGTYYTRGCWAFGDCDYCNLGADCELIGSGSAVTTIKLAEDYADKVGTSPAVYMETFIAGSRSDRSDRLVIEGILFDATCAGLPSSGLHTYSTGCRIEDVRVIGIRGDWTKMIGQQVGIEAFGILQNRSPNSPVHGGCRILGCRVDVPAGEYATAIFCGIVSTAPLKDDITQSVMRDCIATSSQAPTGKQSHASFACNMMTLMDSCTSFGFDRFFFCDTGEVSDVQIRNCVGNCRYCCFDIPSSTGLFLRARILITGCSLKTSAPTANHCIFLLLQDKTTNHDVVQIGRVRVRDCIWTQEGLAVAPYIISVMAANATMISFKGNIFPAAAHRLEGIYDPTPPDAVTFDDET